MSTKVFILDIKDIPDNTADNLSDEVLSHYIAHGNAVFSKRKESKIAKLLLHKIMLGEGFHDYKINYDDNEKPYCEDGRIKFNISHSGQHVVVAVSDKEIGCDVQQIRPYNPKVASRHYCENEYNLIESSEDKDDTFIRLWALKESVLKYTGKGISGGLSSYDFSSAADKDIFSLFGYNFQVIRLCEAYLALCHLDNNIQIIHLNEDFLN